MVLVLLIACSPTGPGELVHLPDAARAGSPGSLGPLGAAWLRADTNHRVDERLTVEVVFPADQAGWLAEGGPYPAVALVQGGAVAVERYRWLSAWLATRGYVVVAARHAHDLALTGSDDTAAALSAVERWSGGSGTLAGAVDPEQPAAVLGHSLGGVVGTVEWLQDERLAYLGLLASYPADFSPVEEQAGPVLSLVGDADGLSSVEECRDGWLRFPDRGPFGVVEGLAHFGWTDDNSQADLDRDGSPTRPVDEARADAMALVDSFLDAWLRGDDAALAALEGGDFAGVAVER